jgi:hypothetical protein
MTIGVHLRGSHVSVNVCDRRAVSGASGAMRV